MNRRPILIALAVLVPLALFGAAKIAASWRPIRMGQLSGVQIPQPMTMRVSRRYLVASDANATDKFDLQSGQRTLLNYGAIAEEGAYMVSLRSPKRGQTELVLNQGTQRSAYNLAPKVTTVADPDGYYADLAALMFSRQTLRIHADHIELVSFGTYHRWNRGSHRLERSVPLYEPTNVNGFVEQQISALTRDGQRVVRCDSQSIEWRSTQGKGAVQKRFKLKGFRPLTQTYEQIQVSDYGALALYNIWVGGARSAQWQVRDTESGRVLWKFDLPSPTNRAVFSSDERWLAVPAANLRWQIRDAQTGTLVRTLSRVPNVRGSAFSPDNATLYSVAGGMLYRQRAR